MNPMTPRTPHRNHQNQDASDFFTMGAETPLTARRARNVLEAEELSAQKRRGVLRDARDVSRKVEAILKGATGERDGERNEDRGEDKEMVGAEEVPISSLLEIFEESEQLNGSADEDDHPMDRSNSRTCPKVSAPPHQANTNAIRQNIVLDEEYDDSDSDDEIMIIDPREASQKARKKWSNPRDPIIIDDDDELVRIKMEPKENAQNGIGNLPIILQKKGAVLLLAQMVVMHQSRVFQSKEMHRKHLSKIKHKRKSPEGEKIRALLLVPMALQISQLQIK
ncbi:hypothetical protein G7Y89_g14985 [Cudoniella acicularis]|uniref:Uncharacterized protein n=1 Tax=Cudoniella acicularis TaxID=354080 RepID=A0A8H4QWI1_9HELO|nr:hypothetical protein G7Y89_g14985 [Cudoniella acicularis]